MNEEKKIEFREARDFGGIINDTFTFVKMQLKPLGMSFLFIIGPLIIIQTIAYTMFNIDASLFKTQKDFNFNNIFGALGIFGAKFSVFLLVVFIEYILLTLIIYECVVIYMNRDGMMNIGVDEIWNLVKKDSLMMAFTYIMNFVVIMMGFVLFVIPGIYLAIVTTIVPFVRIQERTTYFKALRRSRELIKGRWWYTFGLMFLFGIIVGATGFIFQLPHTGLQLFITFNNIEIGTNMFYQVIFGLTNLLSNFSMFLYVLSFTALAFLYFSFVEKKEGAGLLQRIEEIDREDIT